MNIQLKADVRGVLRKARHQNFKLEHALLELIDNSVDEGASKISIYEIDGDLIIEDNGNGFTDIASALIFGSSSKSDRIGRYGVGLKDASVRYSQSTIIESRGVRVVAPWQEFIQGDHTGNLSTEIITEGGDTRIILVGFRERYNRQIQTDEIRRTYYHLLQQGCITIACNGVQLQPLQQPEFTDRIDVKFHWRGRLVKLTGGIFSPSDPMRRAWAGYNPYYKGRLIGPGRITNHGVGEEGCTSFSFCLDLYDDESAWTLATNKDEVEDLDELLEYCYDCHTRELLKKGAEATRQIELKEIEQSITSSLRHDIKSGNQTRNQSGKNRGTVKPTGTGPRKKLTFTATTEGDYDNGRKGKGSPSNIYFKFNHLDGLTLCDIQNQGRSIIITANLNNPFVEEHKDNEPTILCIAKLTYSIHRKFANNDTVPDEIITSIMDDAGIELA